MRPLLKIAAEQWVPWTRVSEENGTVTVSGPMGNVLEIFASMMKFDYVVVRPPDSLWGARLDNGSWSGMVGMLEREEVEFALGPFTITPQRETVVDFTMAVHNDNKAILTVRPGLQSDVSGFLKPFTLEVWLLFSLSILAIGTTMRILTATEDRIFGTFTKNLTVKTAAWVIQTLTQESSEWIPKYDGGRLMVTTWLLASLVFMTSYSGILTAMLTLPRVTIPIDSLEDLVAQDDLPWRLEAGSMATKFLEESEDPVRRKAAAMSSGYFKDCWSSRQAIANGEFAGICDETTMKKAMSWDFSSSGRCHLYITREKVLSSAMMGIAFKRNSSYLADANRIVHIIKHSGILSKWIGDQITNTSQCLRPPSADRREGISALNIEAFLGPLSVLLAGIQTRHINSAHKEVIHGNRYEDPHIFTEKKNPQHKDKNYLPKIRMRRFSAQITKHASTDQKRPPTKDTIDSRHNMTLESKNKHPELLKTKAIGTDRRRLQKNLSLPNHRTAKTSMVTEAVKEKRLNFCRKYQDLTFAKWKKEIFWDESTLGVCDIFMRDNILTHKAKTTESFLMTTT
ncbi:probable glutamate receptor [Penaeus vannamei]|uniref:probable glutamate receptor n=1 Tax=Penaeus vannamei TaxID=6689 RepID=UPI00387F7D06